MPLYYVPYYGCYVKILSNTFIHFLLDVYCYKYVTMETCSHGDYVVNNIDRV